MKRLILAFALAAGLAGCTTGSDGGPVSDEQKDRMIQFAVDRVNAAMALGIIPANVTTASTGLLFTADTACAGMQILIASRPDWGITVPLGSGPFCLMVRNEIMQRATAGASDVPFGSAQMPAQ